MPRTLPRPSHPFRLHTPHTVRITLALLAGAGLFAAALAAAPSSSSTSEKRPLKAVRFDPPTRIEVEANLARIGLTPESVAAAGLSSNQVLVSIGAAADSIRENITALRSADNAIGNARNDIDRLERHIRAGMGSPEDIQALASARAALTAALAQAQSLLNTASAAALSQLPPEPLTTLGTIHDNSAWDLPIQYRAANHEQSEWVNLRDALADQRIAQRLGTAPDPSSTALLASVNSIPAVSNAASNLLNLPQLQAAWIQAVGE